MKRQFFGTDGIRTKVPGSFLDFEFAERLGFALASWLQQAKLGNKSFLIARDTRASGVSLFKGLASGLTKGGVSCTDLGILPTPTLSSIIRNIGAAGGAMITASHNPASDNGIKLFQPTGEKWQDEQEAVLESMLPDSVPSSANPLPAETLEPEQLKALFMQTYSRFINSKFPDLPIVVDAACGATSLVGPALFETLGIRALWRFTEPDGTNINLGCGSEHPQSLGELVRETGAALGLALDGDGDRLVVVNANGTPVDGDHLLGIYSQFLTTPEQPGVVLTEQSNFGLESWLQQQGRPVWRTPVGDRYVWREMSRGHAIFGGENSGHFLYSPHLPCSDGLAFALFLLEFLGRSDRSLEEWQNSIPLLPSQSRSIKLTSKPPLEELPEFQKVIQSVKNQIGNQGRVLVRYSGTEPKIRLLIEFAKPDPIQYLMQELENSVKQFLPVATTG